MEDTVTNDLAAEVERLSELVLDQGQALAALTAKVGRQNNEVRAMFATLRLASLILGRPEITAPLDHADGKPPATLPVRHLVAVK